jgi:(p)ppGpp synthase/HD superfamily hydrolase
VSKQYPLSELEIKAWKFARNAHEGINRKFSGVPYFYHVRQVFKLVKKIDSRDELGAAALLHDTVEDVEEITIDVINKEFGTIVANLVKELTSDKEMLDIMGKPEYLLDKMNVMSDDALIIKLCDRYQNLSDHFSASDKFRRKYYQETKFIIDNLKQSRQLNRKQTIIVDWIEGLLRMMERRYVLTFESFKFTR